MDYFSRKNKSVFCENVDLKKLAEKYKTPLYVYSAKTIKMHLEKLHKALKPIDHLICYSVKTNSNINILKMVGKLPKVGFDVVSGGELFRVIKSGNKPKNVVFAGVGKTDGEIEYALKNKIFMLNAESESEINNINRIAGKLKIKANIAIRVNPDIDAKTHSKITTGKKENKFGISYKRLFEIAQSIKQMGNINFIGLHFHIGSQITTLEPFKKTAKKAAQLIKQLRKKGYDIKVLDLGGGLGINYKTEDKAKTPQQWAKAILPYIKDLKIKLIIEPGRFIVGNAGVLITKVIYKKKSENKEFLIVDAAMNDLIRPSFYDAYHKIEPLETKSSKYKIYDVVGPICETGDTFAKDRKIIETEEGEYLVIYSAGAYGFTMASNYNSRPRPAEVLVVNNKFKKIKRRETFSDLIRGE